MLITDYLKEEHVLFELSSTTKEEVLRELSGVILNDPSPLDADEVFAVLLDREKMGSTGIGEGCAIPHAKIDTTETLRLSFGISRKGIDFDSLDGKPVNIFFLLLAPSKSVASHLNALAKISRILKNNGFREDVLAAKDRKELYHIIFEADMKNE